MSAAPVLPLRRLFKVVNGGTPAGDAENWDGGVAWATPVDLGAANGEVLVSTERTLTEEGLVTGSRAVPARSLLISTRAPIGYVAETSTRTAFNQGCRGLVPIGQLEPRFFRYQLSALGDQLTALGQGSTFLELSGDALADFRIVAPSLATQTNVANYLDRETARIDALVTAKQRMVELLDERWQTVIHDAAAGRLGVCRVSRRASGLPWLEDLPAHWKEGQLKFVAKLGSGHTPSRSRPEWWADPTIPWITTGEVAQMRSDRLERITETREQISELGMANSSAELHPAGTVVLCRTAASAGYSAIMGRDMATSQDFATWTCGPLLNPRFLLLCLRAMRQDLLGRLARGSTHRTIYMPDIESIEVPVPPLAEQEELVDAAYDQQRTLEACATRVSTQIDFLRERRRAVVIAAVTGQLAVREEA